MFALRDMCLRLVRCRSHDIMTMTRPLLIHDLPTASQPNRTTRFNAMNTFIENLTRRIHSIPSERHIFMSGFYAVFAFA